MLFFISCCERECRRTSSKESLERIGINYSEILPTVQYVKEIIRACADELADTVVPGTV